MTVALVVVLLLAIGIAGALLAAEPPHEPARRAKPGRHRAPDVIGA